MTSWSCRAAPAAACRWADRISGAISSTASSSPAASTATEVFGADHAADHHGRRRARWARPLRARSGSTRISCRTYDYWQFWRNTDDRDVGRFLRLFTDLPLDEIARLEALEGAEINEAKKILADAATALCRGARPPTRPPRPRAAPSRKAAPATPCRRFAVAGGHDRHRRCAGRARPVRVEGRGAAADQGRRRARRRREGHRRGAVDHDRRRAGAGSRPARSITAC